MGILDSLQDLTRGKTEAEAEQFIADLYERIGGRAGAYAAAVNALKPKRQALWRRALAGLRSIFTGRSR
jgi:hypothetical protein